MVYRKAYYKLLAAVCEIIDTIEDDPLYADSQILADIVSQMIQIMLVTENIIMSGDIGPGLAMR